MHRSCMTWQYFTSENQLTSYFLLLECPKLVVPVVSRVDANRVPSIPSITKPSVHDHGRTGHTPDGKIATNRYLFPKLVRLIMSWINPKTVPTVLGVSQPHVKHTAGRLVADNEVPTVPFHFPKLIVPIVRRIDSHLTTRIFLI